MRSSRQAAVISIYERWAFVVGISRQWRNVLLVLVVVSGATGCSGGSGGEAFSPSDKIFAGLDAAVVREVLDSEYAKQAVAGDSPAAAAARYQNIVRDFIACRSAMTSYQEWVASGVAGEFPEQPVPTYPAATASSMDREIEAFKADLASGDITLLRDHITNPNGGCGTGIPAKAGDENGPTITDVVTGKA